MIKLMPYVQAGSSICDGCHIRFDRKNMIRIANETKWGGSEVLTRLCKSCVKDTVHLLDPEYYIVRQELIEARAEIMNMHEKEWGAVVYDYKNNKWAYTFVEEED